jgi:hypothetical protein
LWRSRGWPERALLSRCRLSLLHLPVPIVLSSPGPGRRQRLEQLGAAALRWVHGPRLRWRHGHRRRERLGLARGARPDPRALSVAAPLGDPRPDPRAHLAPDPGPNHGPGNHRGPGRRRPRGRPNVVGPRGRAPRGGRGPLLVGGARGGRRALARGTDLGLGPREVEVDAAATAAAAAPGGRGGRWTAGGSSGASLSGTPPWP